MKTALKSLVAAFAFFAGTAQAVLIPTVVDHYSASSFNSAVGLLGLTDTTAYTFDGYELGGSSMPFSGIAASPFGLPGVGFTSINGQIYDAGLITGGDSLIPNPKIYSGNNGPDTGNPHIVTVTVPSLKAIGFLFGSYIFTNSPLTVTVNGVGFAPETITSPLLTLPTVQNNYKFVGFTSSNPITSIVFSSEPAGVYELDFPTVYLGPVAAVSEPSLAVMFSAGLAIMGFFARRKRV